MSGTEWITPRPFIHLAKSVMGDIDLDPASSDVAQRNVAAQRYFTPERDGLKQQWLGRIWLSPPNGRGTMAAFTGKAIDEYAAGRLTEAIIVVPNSLDTAWCHRLMESTQMMCLMRGRIRFKSPARKSATPANGQVFFYLGKRPEQFFDRFQQIGSILMDEELRSRFNAAAAAHPARLAL